MGFEELVNYLIEDNQMDLMKKKDEKSENIFSKLRNWKLFSNKLLTREKIYVVLNITF